VKVAAQESDVSDPSGQVVVRHGAIQARPALRGQSPRAVPIESAYWTRLGFDRDARAADFESSS
jgi:hypothetical protein